MTEEQFKMLRAIQFAQLALLQSIDANIRQMALGEKAARPARASMAEARALVNRLLEGRQRPA